VDGEPHGADLLDAVGIALRDTVVPALSGEARYGALMAASAVAMVARELRSGAARGAAQEAAAAVLGPGCVASMRAGRHDADRAVHEALWRLAAAATALTRPAVLEEEERRLIGADVSDGG